jgi:3-oxoacyl-[acyl-carrier protein] reductase
LLVSSLVRVPSEPQAIDAYQSLRGKVALVTGASRGIGEETATCLAREGAHVVVLDRPGEETTASRLARKLNGSMLLLDVAAPGAAAELTQFLKAGGPGRSPGVDVLVHNAGLTRDRTLARMPKESWDSVLNVNLNAIVHLTKSLSEATVLNDNGRVVVLSSVGGIAGNAGQTNYAASKAGLIGYVRALAPTLAERGVTVNAVAPGFIETQMTARMPLAIREAARRLSALNQGGQPRDVAEVITFLAMPWSHGMTGNVLRVCGGALIGA